MVKKILAFADAALFSAAAFLASDFTVFAEEGVTASAPLKPLSVKDILFWVAFAVLILVVIFISFLFTKSKKFKLKQREKMIENEKTYTPPKIVNVEDNKSEGNK